MCVLMGFLCVLDYISVVLITNFARKDILRGVRN